MDVCFHTKKMQRACSTEALMKKQWGMKTVKKLKQRLVELLGATSLGDMALLPAARLHLLAGGRKGQLAVDLDHPRRLILEPNHSPVPRKKDGGLDLRGVTSVLVLEVVDYH